MTAELWVNNEIDAVWEAEAETQAAFEGLSKVIDYIRTTSGGGLSVWFEDFI